MDTWISITEGKVGASPSGVRDYVVNHLQSPKESGCLAQLPGYRYPEGDVRPHYLNWPLWVEVGQGVGQIDENLIFNLCMGMDLDGRQLTQTDLFRAPVEALLTLPSEVSQALIGNPSLANQALYAVSSAYLQEMEPVAISARCGGRKSTILPAKTLTMAYFHGLSEAGEPHLHAHVLTFTPALDEFGAWHAYANRLFMQRLHAAGGAREKARKALVALLAKQGYVVEIVPGKSDPDHPPGAMVTCPSGAVIYPGLIPRLQGARMLARKAVLFELRVPCLTSKEVPLLLNQVGKFPTAAAGGQRQARFVSKLNTLHLLDEDGRIKQDLLPALAAVDSTMARVEASLRDLPLQESERASWSVREHREALLEHVPEARADDWVARKTWTKRYDELLELAASESYEWAALPITTQNAMHLLAKAGVLKKHYDKSWPTYRLTAKGEARRLLGRQEAAEIKAAVPELFVRTSIGQATPGMILGRLHCAGVHVAGHQLEFRSLGRVTDAEEQIRVSGITESTLTTPDFLWWKRYWDGRSVLPPILARVVQRPEELPSTMPGGLLDQQRIAAARIPEEEPEPIFARSYPDTYRDRSISRSISRPVTKTIERSPAPDETKGHDAPISGSKDAKKR